MHNGSDPIVGPIQLVVIGFPRDAQFGGEIIRALSEVRGHGVIRLIDALFVRKDDQGRTSAMMRESDFTQEQRELLGAVAGGLLGYIAGGEQGALAGAAQAQEAVADNAFGLGLGDLQKVTESIKPGTSALLLLIEHSWALDLKGAVRGSGGIPLVQGFLTPEALLMVGAEVRAIAEAENTIALAEAAEGIAVLEALATIEAADEVKQAAAAETARVLLGAGLIEAAAAQDVVDTLVAAGLIEDEARTEAVAALADRTAQANQLRAAQPATV